MKKSFFLAALLATAALASAQDLKSVTKMPDNRQHFGLKAGYNWSYITGSAQGFKKDNNAGFMIAGFYATEHNGKGYRTELVFSRQGYSFDDGGKSTNVQNDYIYMPHFTTFTIAKKVQLQAGAQIGFLLNAKKGDSSITNFMNRFDYGFAGGLEIYPFKGIIIGGRYNLGLGKLYKQQTEATTPSPFPLPFDPDKTNFKNALVQFFVGYRF